MCSGCKESKSGEGTVGCYAVSLGSYGKKRSQSNSQHLKSICGIFVVGGLRLRRALHRCVLQETAPRPGFGFSALPVLQCGILLFFLGQGCLQLPIHSTSDLESYLHSLYLWVDLRPSEVENLLLLPLLPLLQENLETCYQSYINLNSVSSPSVGLCVRGQLSAVVDWTIWPFWTSPGPVTRGWLKLEGKTRWPSKHAPEELDSSVLGPIQLKGCPGAISPR